MTISDSSAPHLLFGRGRNRNQSRNSSDRVTRGESVPATGRSLGYSPRPLSSSDRFSIRALSPNQDRTGSISPERQGSLIPGNEKIHSQSLSPKRRTSNSAEDNEIQPLSDDLNTRIEFKIAEASKTRRKRWKKVANAAKVAPKLRKQVRTSKIQRRLNATPAHRPGPKIDFNFTPNPGDSSNHPYFSSKDSGFHETFNALNEHLNEDPKSKEELITAARNGNVSGEVQNLVFKACPNESERLNKATEGFRNAHSRIKCAR